jgi:hypothetical protein
MLRRRAPALLRELARPTARLLLPRTLFASRALSAATAPSVPLRTPRSLDAVVGTAPEGGAAPDGAAPVGLEENAGLPPGLTDDVLKCFLLTEWESPREYTAPRRALYKMQRSLQLADLWPFEVPTRMEERKKLLRVVQRLVATGAFRKPPRVSSDADGDAHTGDAQAPSGDERAPSAALGDAAQVEERAPTAPLSDVDYDARNVKCRRRLLYKISNVDVVDLDELQVTPWDPTSRPHGTPPSREPALQLLHGTPPSSPLHGTATVHAPVSVDSGRSRSAAADEETTWRGSVGGARHCRQPAAWRGTLRQPLHLRRRRGAPRRRLGGGDGRRDGCGDGR